MAEPVKTRIVVADDDVDILDLLVFKLNQAGFETTAVPDGWRPSRPSRRTLRGWQSLMS
jgi:CheY-like chemotaxis protein